MDCLHTDFAFGPPEITDRMILESCITDTVGASLILSEHTLLEPQVVPKFPVTQFAFANSGVSFATVFAGVRSSLLELAAIR